MHCLAQPKLLHLPRPCKRHAHKEERVQSRPIGLADSASAPRSGAYVCFSLPHVPATCPPFRRSICVPRSRCLTSALPRLVMAPPWVATCCQRYMAFVALCLVPFPAQQHSAGAAAPATGSGSAARRPSGTQGGTKAGVLCGLRTSTSFVQGAGIMP